MATAGKWNPSQVRDKELNATWPSRESLGPMVLVGPTSVSCTGNAGASISIVGNGTVQFQYCETLSVDGVFSSAYDNYLIMWNAIDITSQSARSTIQFRSNKANNAAAQQYYTQDLVADSPTISGTLTTAWYGWAVSGTNMSYNGTAMYVFGPYLKQATTWRSVSASGVSGGAVGDLVGVHSVPERFDGFTIGRASFSYLGSLAVYGLV